MSALPTPYLLSTALIFILNLNAQDKSIEIYVYNHHTYAPLDSALVKVFSEGAILTSSYTGVDGKTQLTITTTGVEKDPPRMPHTFSVSENYPNPFRDETWVDFSIPESQTVKVDVYNIIGQRVLSEELPISAGYYTMNLSMTHLSTGIYFLRFRGMEQQAIKLMKVGGDLRFTGDVSGRGNIQITSRGVINIPVLKTSEKNGGLTIQVEKDRYETWSITKQIESDTELTVPLVLLAEHLLTDIDGNVYQTVKIGDQVWMAENLRTTRYRNGDVIPTDLSDDEWQNTTSGAYAIYPHDDVEGIDSDEKMVAAYGKLYNWYAVDDARGLCPEGWHVPTDDEWTMLVKYLGGVSVAGTKMKSTHTEPDPHPRWRSPNSGATNESGFSGLPSGSRSSSGNFFLIGSICPWWSSTEYSTSHVWYVNLGYYYGFVVRDYGGKQFGDPVRCLRDD